MEAFMKPNYQLTLSKGPDKIPARLLKDSCFSIVPFLKGYGNIFFLAYCQELLK